MTLLSVHMGGGELGATKPHFLFKGILYRIESSLNCFLVTVLCQKHFSEQVFLTQGPVDVGTEAQLELVLADVK